MPVSSVASWPSRCIAVASKTGVRDPLLPHRAVERELLLTVIVVAYLPESICFSFQKSVLKK